MKPLRLGVPEIVSAPGLPRRLAWLTGARLVFLVVALGLVSLFYLRGKDPSSFTLRIAIATLVAGFSLAGVYATVLRSGRRLELLGDVQLALDQLTFSVVAYLTGGPTSGATSFYGLTCLIGASLAGLRGALVAAGAGAVSYGGLVLAMQRNWLHPPPDQPAGLYLLSDDEAWFYLLVNWVVLVVVAVLSGTLADRLRWAGGALALATERADQAERMAALGRLATGLAHEIRNPLGSISASVQLLKTTPELGQEDQRLCDIIAREASRLNDLVTDMLDLSRPRKPNPELVDAASTARDLVTLASGWGRGVSDVSVLYEGVAHAQVTADAAQLRQLIWNLVRNAVQASLPGEPVYVRLREQAPDTFELEVADKGAGIDLPARERLFDAFFTTRSHGTGIGLAVVKRIADEHGFPIRVDSEAGRGAVFRVLLKSS